MSNSVSITEINFERCGPALRTGALLSSYKLVFFCTLGLRGNLLIACLYLYLPRETLLLFIEYATSAGHHKNIYTHRNDKKDIKHSGKKTYTHKNTIKSKA